MRLLLDTAVLIWTAVSSTRLASADLDIIRDPDNQVAFSAVSIWEVAIKFARGRAEFTVPPSVLLSEARTMGFEELSVSSEDAASVAALPRHHGDPFDRLLVAQAIRGPRQLLTSDRLLLRYSELVKLTA